MLTLIDRARDEGGFTVIELLVATALTLLVLMPSLMVLDESTRHAHRDNARGVAIREAQVGLDRMVRELRHTTLVHTAATQVIEVTVSRRGVDSRVRFDCSVAEPGRPGLRRCTRTVVSGPGAGTTEPLVRSIDAAEGSSTVFTYTYTPATGTARHVAVRFGVAADDGRVDGYDGRTVLADGTGLRNVDA